MEEGLVVVAVVRVADLKRSVSDIYRSDNRKDIETGNRGATTSVAAAPNPDD